MINKKVLFLYKKKIRKIKLSKATFKYFNKKPNQFLKIFKMTTQIFKTIRGIIKQLKTQINLNYPINCMKTISTILGQ